MSQLEWTLNRLSYQGHYLFDTIKVLSSWSVNLLTLFLGRLKLPK